MPVLWAGTLGVVVAAGVLVQTVGHHPQHPDYMFNAGRDAWAALERLRSAQEQLAREGSAVLRPLRRELGAHLTPDLR